MIRRIRLAAALVGAVLSAIACFATIIEPRWFELLFDESPDGGDGSLETFVAVATSALACVIFSLIGRHEWRLTRRDTELATASQSRND